MVPAVDGAHAIPGISGNGGGDRFPAENHSPGLRRLLRAAVDHETVQASLRARDWLGEPRRIILLAKGQANGAQKRRVGNLSPDPGLCVRDWSPEKWEGFQVY